MRNLGLKSVDSDLWVFDNFFTLAGCRASVRMTIVKTENGLILYSPEEMDGGQRAAVDALGTVHSIVVPNLYHHLFLRAAIEAWPEARIWIPEGLERKIGPIPGAEVMRPDTDFGGTHELDTFIFSGHAIQETLFWHTSTKTLITSDLIYNYQEEQFAAEKLFFRCIGAYGAPKLPFYHRFAIRDRTSLSSLIDWVGEREIRRLVMSHGRIYEEADAGDVFKKAWAKI